jgi:K+-transporting ATPase A subunit
LASGLFHFDVIRVVRENLFGLGIFFFALFLLSFGRPTVMAQKRKFNSLANLNQKIPLTRICIGIKALQRPHY